jgi:phosphatidylglycerol lysyltransferase
MGIGLPESGKQNEVADLEKKYSSASVNLIREKQNIEQYPDLSSRMIYSFYIFAGIVGAYVLLKMVQPVRPTRKRSQTELQRAREIVDRFGKSSYAFLTLLGDKIYYFTTGGSLVAYKVVGRVAVALGDPIGPLEDIPKTISGFQKLCAINDWIPAFCFTLPDNLYQYRLAGFECICMGHEAIIRLDKFSLSGRSSSNFRKRYNRMNKLGFQVNFYEPPIPHSVLSELREISEEWLKITNRKEKRFFLGRFDEDYVRTSTVAAVKTPDGKTSAFVNLVPEYQRNEISIDLMRRRGEILSGTMDFLFVSLFLWARQQGYDTFNLGLCALSGVGKKPDDSLFERLLHVIYEYGNWIYDFKGVYFFKEKFQPCWAPQYLVFPTLSNLPAVWIAMAKVNSAEK